MFAEAFESKESVIEPVEALTEVTNVAVAFAE